MSIGFWQIFLILSIIFVIFILPSLWLYLINKNNTYKKSSKEIRFVGFWVRFGAGLTDIIILFAAQYIFTVVLFGNFLTESGWALFMQGLISWAYICILQSSKRQATLGMMLLKFKICDHNFERVGLGKITLRYFAITLSSFILLIGFFMIGWTKKKQGLHDIFAKTLHIEDK